MKIIIEEISDSTVSVGIEGHPYRHQDRDRFHALGHLLFLYVASKGGMPPIDGIDVLDRDGERYPMACGRDFLKHLPLITDPAVLDVLDQLANNEL